VQHFTVAKNGNQQLTTGLILITLGLGFFFTYAQIEGWEQLSEKGMGFKIEEVDGVLISNWNKIADIKGEYGVDYYVHKNGQKLVYDNGDFYMPEDQFKTKPVTTQVEKTSNLNGSFIAVLIFVHLTHLIFGLIYLLVLTYRSITGRINKDNTISLYTGGLYWHFLGILWIYLFVFLFFIH
jgi:heme/copper-type cytochrome/quinol oxidase subunit 3